MDNESYYESVADMFFWLQIHEILKLDSIDYLHPLVKPLRQILKPKSRFKETFKFFSNNSRVTKFTIQILRIFLENIGISLEKRRLAYNERIYLIEGSGLDEIRGLNDDYLIKDWFLNRYREYGKPLNCGIYKITCIATGHFYIGSSQRIKTRFGNHIFILKNKNHPNFKLQELWDLHKETFTFEILDLTTDYKNKERQLIKDFKKSPLILNYPTQRIIKVTFIPRNFD